MKDLNKGLQNKVFDDGKFSCYLIGEDSMADRCVKVILEGGHNLLGICTPNNKLAMFAEQNKIPCTDSLEIFESWMIETQCDFLFSVVNAKILKANIINQPRQFSINFHNAPLPKYAGVNATSWAILNGEKFHGATWHVLEEGVDTGDVLKQSIFKIDDHDTNFSLNVKCIEHGMPLFADLLKELADGSYTRTKQDFGQRSYYTLFEKPKNFGVISGNSSVAEGIYTLHRALNFSEYANKLCLPKFVYKNVVFFAKRINILDKKGDAEPGSIVGLSDKGLRIATIANDVLLSQLTDISNKNYEVLDFVAAHNIVEGQKLTSFDPIFLDKLAFHGEKLAKFESYWVKIITQANSLNFLFLNAPKLDRDPVINEKLIFSDETFAEKISQLIPGHANPETALITIFLLYIYRLNNYDDYSVGYKSPYAEDMAEDISDFFAEIVPMNLSFSADIDFDKAFSLVAKLLDTTRAKNTFSKDINLRYPQLYENSLSLPIVISASKPTGANNRCLCFVINGAGIKAYFPDDLDELNLKIVENMAGHLQIFINSILQNKNLQVKDIPFLTEAEKHLLIDEYNDTATDYPKNSSLVEIFEQQVLSYPNNIALKHGDDSMTYEKLNQKANKLAYYLSSLGVKNGSIVATYFNKGINSILSILAVVKAGATYTPIDPMYPQKYIKHIIKDTGALILLTQEKDRKNLERCLPSGKFIILSIDDSSLAKKIFNSSDDTNINVQIKPTDLAYVMYTSGSTGVPKGVMIPHCGIVRLVKDTNYIKFEPSDCISQAASISFDAATFEIWGALLNGATLACVDNSIISNSSYFADFLQKEKVSIVIFVSAVFDRHATSDPSMFRNLKCLLVGGDVLNVDTIYEVANCSKGSPLRILNIYGPTENSNCTTIYDIPKNFDKNRSIPIGKPIANTTTYVLDKHLNLMPIGIPGELCTGGDGLATGYLNREDLTKEKFVTICLNEKVLRVYKIGDLVKYLPDGNIDYICRIDKQVKVRGFRIELDAIELCLLNSNLINQCAVVAQQDEKMRKTLIAYVVFKKKKDIPFLRRFLGKHLPYYMVPNLFVALDSLPQTPNGKVDKKELLLKFKEKSYESCNYVAPRNDLENKLADIWKELLNLNLVGVKDNFFDVGGYSLLITEMIVKIKEQFSVEFSLPMFIETPTIENLSGLIDPESAKSLCNSNIVSQFESDIFLDPKIKPLKTTTTESSAENQRITLLTGATGFLGVHILNDLYQLTNAKIYCLVRESSIDAAEQKLRKIIKKYHLDSTLPVDSERIEVVMGDLSKPDLGIEKSVFDKLSAEVDAVYHCGANVHHIYNYEMLREANVLSTLEIVKFATVKKNKHIHYISTLSAVTDHVSSDGLVSEDFLEKSDLQISALSGYAQTKLASEIILSKAYKRGIDVFVYRPSWIIGSPKRGSYCLENNHLLLLLKGCMQLESAPKLNVKLSMLPVDFVSSFVVKVAENDKNINSRVFNLVNPFAITWNNLIKQINVHGYKVALYSPADWYRNHLSKIDESNAAYPLMPLYSDGGISWARAQSVFSKSNTYNTELANKILGLTYEKIDEFFLKCCFEFFYQDDIMQLAV